MDQLIVQAIREKRLLSFTYDGHPRIVEPHCYGITTASNDALCCYQVGGSGVHADSKPWHLMVCSKIVSLSLLEEKFSVARPGYRRGDKRMVTIYCEL